MDGGLDSWSLDEKDCFDANEFYNQQKEIQVALSSAFDDISNLSDVTVSDEQTDQVPNNNETKIPKNQLAHLNSSSTPIRLQQMSYNNYSKKLPDYHHNISDVEEEESYVPINGGHLFLDDENINQNNEFINDFNKDKISSSLLMENDKLSKQLFGLKGKCIKIGSNYEALQKKFHQLFKENKSNLEIIEQLQSKLITLESNLKDEKQNKENMIENTNFLESQLESLEDTLSEYRNSDFITRTNETQEKLISNLRQKYEKDLNLLRHQNESLAQKLLDKQNEINAKDAMIEKYNEKRISSSLQRMMETKEILKNEMKEQFDKEIKLAKERNKQDLLQSFDQRIDNLKDDWQKKLQGDVVKIIGWINSNGTSKQCPNMEFVSLVKLCQCIENKVVNSNLHKQEQIIEMKIAHLKESKLQLQEALIESRMSTSNMSNNSDKSQLLDELRNELDKFKEESQILSHKLIKYKKHYLLLQQRHQQEIESLKNQFSAYIKQNTNKY